MKNIVTFFAVFLLLAACTSYKNNFDVNASSPFVGKWLWEPDGEKGISCLYIGERGDSLFISVYGKFPYAWLFLPKYAGDPADEIYSADVCVASPEKENRVAAVYSYSPTNKKSLPRYSEVSMKLKNKNTLKWKVKLFEDMNVPTKMVFKRESYKNYEFGEKVNFMYENK